MNGFELTDLHKSFGSQPVLAGLELSAPAGSFTAVLGASGSGKTTLLRLLAGFERPDRGTITIGGRVVSDEHRHVRPEQRRIGYVPQDGTLFPHLTVEANIGFGLKRGSRPPRVEALLELVGLGGLGPRYPHQLSGGQQQRVALARALAIEPDVVLLDEPFASLDTNLRASVSEEVRAVLRMSEATAILVTHDQSEALSLADSVAVLRDGAIAQHAPPAALYTRPLDPELASFVGVANLIDGTFASGFAETPLGKTEALWEGDPPRDGSPVTVLVRPEQIGVRPSTLGAGAAGRVGQVVYHGHDSLLHLETTGAHGAVELVARRVGPDEPAVGDEVSLGLIGPVFVWPARSA